MIKNIGQELFNTLRSDLDRVAVISQNRQITALELLRRTAGVVEALQDHGLGKGDRVVFCLSDNVDSITALLASWYVSATPINLDFRARPDSRRLIATTINAKLIVETRRPARAEGYDSIIWDNSWTTKSPDMLVSPSKIDCSNPAFLTASSGTTGHPKIYVLSHEALYKRLGSHTHASAGSNDLLFTPMSMSFSATRNLVLAFLCKGALIKFEPPLFSTSEVIENLLSSGVTAGVLPPPIIHNILQEIGEQPRPFFPNLTDIRSIGGPLAIEDKIAAYKNISNGFAMAYSSGLTGTISFLGGQDLLNRPETAGRIFSDVEVKIIDQETGQVLGYDEPGLIRVSSPTMASNIIEIQDANNAERFGAGWGIPGDIGSLSEDGFLSLVGREGDMIVRGGVNVPPQEIENALRRDARVQDVGVVGVDDDVMGQEIALFIVAKSGTEDDFNSLCRQSFAPERRPRIIKVVKALPYNANGKLLRRKLIEMLDD